ncbi:hypothetical protein [Clostridium sporogenes]|uniref:hypothetical protein n=1 Tax=Clostridium sporogenes TaxID=1509 RepID=UPI000717B2C4|nr:hypothetical protein [Clostridium sporogenes]KRU39994.1 hypothetical protein VT94_24710 [Clostridium sporogenes]MBY7065189.1 hypothetical protein [Clostridium sporogenes]MBY7071841.1 hypothetical protein [Clostridium sporogenes]MCW6064741.1 hypothetical protein [Clostridium sporogenes]OQP88532.1 hypothetical protein VT93_0201760 [Clostridium sporogenes]
MSKFCGTKKNSELGAWTPIDPEEADFIEEDEEYEEYEDEGIEFDEEENLIEKVNKLKNNNRRLNRPYLLF